MLVVDPANVIGLRRAHVCQSLIGLHELLLGDGDAGDDVIRRDRAAGLGDVALDRHGVLLSWGRRED